MSPPTPRDRKARVWVVFLALMILSQIPGKTFGADSRLDWWREARFGMFVHWGPVSLKGTEIGWSRGTENLSAEEYDSLYRRFNPSNFNAETWVRIARQAGARYLVFTTKHHDGFCNWDTKETDYQITRTPFGRDVTRELADACHRNGLVFCTYHSILDWWHPDYPLGSPGGRSQKPEPHMDRYNEYLKRQVAELIQEYGPLGVMWFDGEWEAPWNAERGRDLYEHCRRLQDSIIVNNRVSVGRSGMAGTTLAGAGNPGDYDTPEQEVGKYQDTKPWESCITICQQWAWKPDDKLKSLRECIETLVRCAGGDGNLLLNVGPMPDGRIEPRQAVRLREIGRWLAVYGDSIYGTRGGPWKPAQDFASTRKGHRVYLHLLGSPPREVVLPAIPARVVRANVLTGGTVKVKQLAGQLKLTWDPESRIHHERGAEALISPWTRRAQEGTVDVIIRLELDRPAMQIPAISAAPGSERSPQGGSSKPAT